MEIFIKTLLMFRRPNCTCERKLKINCKTIGITTLQYTEKEENTFNMKFSTVLITGASRGLGLDFVRQLSEDGSVTVIATSRNHLQSKELAKLAEERRNVSVLKLDVTDTGSFLRLVGEVEGVLGDQLGLNLLINNAGVNSLQTYDQVTVEGMVEEYRINTIAPLMLSKALQPLLKRSSSQGQTSCIVTISSELGSIVNNTYGKMYPYRASKAAVNMVMKSLSIELAGDGIGVISLHPGWVRTGMGGDQAPLSPSESVQGMLKVLRGHDQINTGQFISNRGETLPW